MNLSGSFSSKNLKTHILNYDSEPSRNPSNFINSKRNYKKPMMLNKSLKLEFYSGYNLKNERLEAGNYSFVVYLSPTSLTTEMK